MPLFHFQLGFFPILNFDGFDIVPPLDGSRGQSIPTPPLVEASQALPQHRVQNSAHGKNDGELFTRSKSKSNGGGGRVRDKVRVRVRVRGMKTALCQYLISAL